PDPIRGNYRSFLGEAVGTATMLIFIFACVDRHNVPPTHFSPLAIGIAVATILAAFNSPGAIALNPARDFAPRVLMLAAGYGKIVFTAHDGYAWVPVVGPLVGGVVGGALYDIFIATAPDPEEHDSKSF
ncbi:aquaporin-like protein, partial [Piptocephalis cylindrospora]